MAAEKESKKSVQAKFDEFLEYVRMELAKAGRQILNVDGQWYEYHDGYWAAWTSSETRLFNTFLYDLASLHEFPYSTQKSALWTTLEAAFGARKPVVFDAKPMIVCNTKTYFLDENKLKKHSPAHYATRRVSIDVDPSATCPNWLAVLDRMFDDLPKETRKENIQFIREWLGVAIVGGSAVKSRRDMRKGLFLFGDKGTGKSSIADVLLLLLGGEDRVASPSLTSLSSRFGLEPLIGKSAIITNEAANARTAADSATLKCLITGDQLQADRKHMGVVPFRFHGPVLFTTNNLPKIEDESDALYDRTVVLEFTRQFNHDDVKSTLGGYGNVVEYMVGTNQLPGILNWCLEGYDQAQENKRLTVPSSATSSGERFKRQNDKVFDFVRECLVYDSKSGCASEALTIACVEFCQTYHDHKLSVAAAQRALSRTVRAAIPGVIAEQAYLDKTQFRAYQKLRLTEKGLHVLEGALSKPYPNIKQAMKRCNYRYT